MENTEFTLDLLKAPFNKSTKTTEEKTNCFLVCIIFLTKATCSHIYNIKNLKDSENSLHSPYIKKIYDIIMDTKNQLTVKKNFNP